ncbi:AAA family ATPase [Clostridium sp. E02]|uniref:AAA family ATPase n=1 Tax=Clostridium sp. E02 TaxID=2487134 RepID=UPI000F52F045|nr:AAA family ATPase [Clostridium sp. E02]
MNGTTVRISEIELYGIKNTRYGKIDMPSFLDKKYHSQEADILGIYGQNGSGKTAVIEAMELMQFLMTGKSLPDDTVHYLSEDTKSSQIIVKFSVDSSETTVLAEYGVTLKRSSERKLEIARETLSSSLYNGTKFNSKKTLLDYSPSNEGPIFTPKYRFEELVKHNDETFINLRVARKLSQKNNQSFLFGSEGRHVFLSVPENTALDYSRLIKTLYEYSSYNLFVISNAHSGAIGKDFVLPFAFRLNLGQTVAKGDLYVQLDEPTIIGKESFSLLEQIITEMNSVLSAMIPGLTIGIHNFGEQLKENGSSGYKIQLVSKRGEIIIPLQYESEGIIKIISVLNVLMCVYNHPSMCLVIDELDSGIYEYLLGELLLVLEKGAKGQLLFTSHNLRALEMLHKRSIVFSTTNPDNRYLHLKNAKSKSNLRDIYLRSITLGGQKEPIYEETDRVEIGRAFRRAGKAVIDDLQN